MQYTIYLLGFIILITITKFAKCDGMIHRKLARSEANGAVLVYNNHLLFALFFVLFLCVIAIARCHERHTNHTLIATCANKKWYKWLTITKKIVVVFVNSLSSFVVVFYFLINCCFSAAWWRWGWWSPKPDSPRIRTTRRFLKIVLPHIHTHTLLNNIYQKN